jgi:hypothetical protein
MYQGDLLLYRHLGEQRVDARIDRLCRSRSGWPAQSQNP